MVKHMDVSIPPSSILAFQNKRSAGFDDEDPVSFWYIQHLHGFFSGYCISASIAAMCSFVWLKVLLSVAL